MPQPSSVAIAVRLMWIGAVLSVIPVLVIPTLRDGIRTELEKDELLSSGDIDAAVGVAIAVGIVGGLVGTGLWIWMAVMNGRGRSWARVTATVFGGLYLAMNLIGLLGDDAFGVQQSGPIVVLTVITMVVALTTIVFLWQPTSSTWFEARPQ